MIRHLTPADYRVQRWANGRGETVEIARHDGPDRLRWRLSVAQVVEDGPFSLFPTLNRSLTVIDGPGFFLRGDGVDLKADPLVPVAFPGDIALRAQGVTAPSRDFNVMVAADLPAPQVWVATGAVAPGGLTALYALTPMTVSGLAAAAGDTLFADGGFAIETGKALAVRLPA